MGVNGKGISREFALASAYGELMERLQSRALIRPTFGIFNYLEAVFHDEIEPSLEDFIRDYHYLFNNYVSLKKIEKFNAVLQSNNLIRRCIPFFSLTEQQIKYLPYKLITMCCGSNGLCAGNTKEEAIIQGICEIFERYVHRKIFNETIELSDISLDVIKSLHSYPLIHQIIKEGYFVSIKYCFIQGIFPVVALLILNKDKNKYKFVLGCDPDIDIALQRCVTEMFQGIKFDSSFENRMIKINWDVLQKFDIFREKEWIMSTINNTGHHPVSIFTKQQNSNNIISFLKTRKKNNKQYLKDIIFNLEKLGHKIFIRNHSYLGFPCYRVYIPSMTEWTELSEAELVFLKDEYSIKKTYCNLKSSDIYELSMLKASLENLNNIPKYKFYGFPRALGGLLIDKTEEQEKLNYNLILFLINIQTKDHDDAFKYLNFFVDNNENQFVNIDYIQAMRFFLMNQSIFENCGENHLVNSKILNEIYSDYLNNYTIKRYALPSCPDCQKCNIEKCYYQEWKYIDERLRSAERETGLSQEFII